MEYAIAILINITVYNDEEILEKIINTLSTASYDYYQAPWFSVIRQLLSLTPVDIFYYIFERLNKEEIKNFRIVSLGITSRENIEDKALQKLCNIALMQGGTYQKILLSAIDYTPASLTDQILDKLLLLFSNKQLLIADEAAEIVGTKLNFYIKHNKISVNYYLQKALNGVNIITENLKDEQKRKNLFEKIISRCFKDVEYVDIETLVTLRNFYYQTGKKVTKLIFKFHNYEEVPPEEASHFLRKILKPDSPSLSTRKMRELKQEFEQVIFLFNKGMPGLIGNSDSCIWSTWLEALHDYSLPEGWDRIMASTVGYQAVKQPSLLQSILRDIVYGDMMHLSRSLGAIKEAIGNGASNSVAEKLLEISVDDIYEQERLRQIATVLRELHDFVKQDNWTVLAQWIEPIIQKEPAQLKPIQRILTPSTNDDFFALSKDTTGIPKNLGQLDKNSQRIIVQEYYEKAKKSDILAVSVLI
ncbi:MAG: hypothetical protein F6J86_35840 [Symploca sp. SIO1B1]|nr:hypothetical protein [Symploca sp. SIO1B1]